MHEHVHESTAHAATARLKVSQPGITQPAVDQYHSGISTRKVTHRQCLESNVSYIALKANSHAEETAL